MYRQTVYQPTIHQNHTKKVSNSSKCTLSLQYSVNIADRWEMYRCIKLKHIETLKYLAITIATTIYWFLSFSLPPQTQPQNYTHWEGETRSEVQLLCHLKTWKTTKMFFSHSQLPPSIYLSIFFGVAGSQSQQPTPEGELKPWTVLQSITGQRTTIHINTYGHI